MTSTATRGGVAQLPPQPGNFTRNVVSQGGGIMGQIYPEVSYGGPYSLPSQRSNADGSNKPVVHTIYPKVWSKDKPTYDEWIYDGDIIFANSFDRLTKTQEMFPQQTCINFQCLQDHIKTERAAAFEDVYSAHKNAGHNVITDASDLDIDYGNLANTYKVQSNHYLSLGYERYGEMSRRAENIMEKDVQRMIKSVEEENMMFSELDKEVPFVKGALTSLRSLVDNNVNKLETVKIFDMVADRVVYLHPKLITMKWKLLGTVTSSFNVGSNWYTGYANQKGVSFASSGPIDTKNIFGPSRIRSKGYSNRRMNLNTLKKNGIPILKDYLTLYLYITRSEKKRATISGMKFNPYIIKPICSVNQREAETFMEMKHPIVEEYTNYRKVNGRFSKINKKPQKIRINRGFSSSWTAGQVRLTYDHAKLTEEFYLVATGQKDADIKTVLDCRNKVHLVRLDKKKKKY